MNLQNHKNKVFEAMTFYQNNIADSMFIAPLKTNNDNTYENPERKTHPGQLSGGFHVSSLQVSNAATDRSVLDNNTNAIKEKKTSKKRNTKHNVHKNRKRNIYDEEPPACIFMFDEDELNSDYNDHPCNTKGMSNREMAIKQPSKKVHYENNTIAILFVMDTTKIEIEIPLELTAFGMYRLINKAFRTNFEPGDLTFVMIAYPGSKAAHHSGKMWDPHNPLPFGVRRLHIIRNIRGGSNLPERKVINTKKSTQTLQERKEASHLFRLKKKEIDADKKEQRAKSGVMTKTADEIIAKSPVQKTYDINKLTVKPQDAVIDDPFEPIKFRYEEAVDDLFYLTGKTRIVEEKIPKFAFDYVTSKFGTVATHVNARQICMGITKEPDYEKYIQHLRDTYEYPGEEIKNFGFIMNAFFLSLSTNGEDRKLFQASRIITHNHDKNRVDISNVERVGFNFKNAFEVFKTKIFKTVDSYGNSIINKIDTSKLKNKFIQKLDMIGTKANAAFDYVDNVIAGPKYSTPTLVEIVDEVKPPVHLDDSEDAETSKSDDKDDGNVKLQELLYEQATDKGKDEVSNLAIFPKYPRVSVIIEEVVKLFPGGVDYIGRLDDKVNRTTDTGIRYEIHHLMMELNFFQRIAFHWNNNTKNPHEVYYSLEDTILALEEAKEMVLAQKTEKINKLKKCINIINKNIDFSIDKFSDESGKNKSTVEFMKLIPEMQMEEIEEDSEDSIESESTISSILDTMDLQIADNQPMREKIVITDLPIYNYPIATKTVRNLTVFPLPVMGSIVLEEALKIIPGMAHVIGHVDDIIHASSHRHMLHIHSMSQPFFERIFLHIKWNTVNTMDLVNVYKKYLNDPKGIPKIDMPYVQTVPYGTVLPRMTLTKIPKSDHAIVKDISHVDNPKPSNLDYNPEIVSPGMFVLLYGLTNNRPVQPNVANCRLSYIYRMIKGVPDPVPNNRWLEIFKRIPKSYFSYKPDPIGYFNHLNPKQKKIYTALEKKIEAGIEIKTITKIHLKADCTDVYKPDDDAKFVMRIIYGVHPYYVYKLGDYFWQFAKHLEKTWFPRTPSFAFNPNIAFCYPIAITTKEINEFVNIAMSRNFGIYSLVFGDDNFIIDRRNKFKFIETDYSQFDSTQRRGQALEIVPIVLKENGDYEQLDIYKRMLNERVSFYDNKTDTSILETSEQKRINCQPSGSPATGVGNTLVNVFVQEKVIEQCLVNMDIAITPAHYAYYGLRAKVKVSSEISDMTFLKGTFLLDDGGKYRWIRHLGLLIKFGKVLSDPNFMYPKTWKIGKKYRQILRSQLLGLGYLKFCWFWTAFSKIVKKLTPMAANIELREEYKVYSDDDNFKISDEVFDTYVKRRYNLDRSDLLDFLNHLSLIEVIPCVYSHFVLNRIESVDG